MAAGRNGKRFSRTPGFPFAHGKGEKMEPRCRRIRVPEERNASP